MSLPYLNSTQIPNIIFDKWMAKLSPSEFKVLLCICRKTYGWHKDQDYISISQLEKMAALSRQGVFNSIKKLCELGLVIKSSTVSAQGDPNPNCYEINLQPPEEEKDGGGSQLSLRGVVNSVYGGVVNSVDPQKKDYTKETIQRSESSPEADDVCVFLFSKLKEVQPSFKKPNMEKWAKEVDKILRVDKRKGVDLKAVITWAFNQEDNFWPTAIQSPSTLRKLFDRAWMKMNVRKMHSEKDNQKHAQKVLKNYSFFRKRGFNLHQEGNTFVIQELEGQRRSARLNIIHPHFKETLDEKLKELGAM